MYTSFDGDYRRRPMQSLGGHSMSTNRDSIIKKSQEQRQKRSELRKQTASATQIQSYIRSFLTRKHTKSSERTNFDEFLRLRKNNLEANFDANEISYVLQRFVFFYDSGQDSDRLVSFWLISNLIFWRHLIYKTASHWKSMRWLFCSWIFKEWCFFKIVNAYWKILESNLINIQYWFFDLYMNSLNL